MVRRWLPLLVLGLAGCSNRLVVQDSGDPGDTADTAETAETGETADTDTADTDTADTADTGDTADTADTGDTGQTTCVDDSREEDDILGQATALSPGIPVSGTICAGDVDWFDLPVDDGCVVDVALTFVQADGDLDLAMYDAQQHLLDLSVSETDDEAIHYIASGGQDLYLEVLGYLDAQNDYTLQATETCPSGPPTCPADDPFEDNDDPSTATPLNLLSTRLDAAVCSSDEDWYRVSALSSCVGAASIDFTNATGDLDLWLYDADGNLVDWSDSRTTDGEGFVHHFEADGAYYLLVDGYQGASNDYALSFDLACDTHPPEDCATDGDDLFEPNDDPASAFPLNPVDTQVQAITCSNDDWYYVPDVAPGCLFEAYLDFDATATDLDLQLVDSTDTVVGRSASTDQTEYESWIADIGGPLFVDVSGKAGDTGPYTLSTWVTCPQTDAPTCPADDPYEDNDEPLSGMPLNYRYTDVNAAACDEDWWAAEVPAGCWLEAASTTEGTYGGPLDVDLYGDVDLLDWSHGTGGYQYVSYIPDPDALLDLDVYPAAAGDEASYRLQSSVVCPPSTPLACPANDAFEPNDSPSSPYVPELNRNETNLSGILCRSDGQHAPDEDYFWARVGQGCTLDVEATFAQEDGDIDVYVLDPADLSTPLAIAGSTTDDEHVTWTAPSSRDVLVELYNWDGSTKSPGYGLTTSISCP